MDKLELTRRLARATHSSQAQAADYLDLAVLSILKRAKRGHAANWPGLGQFTKDLSFQSDSSQKASRPRLRSEKA